MTTKMRATWSRAGVLPRRRVRGPCTRRVENPASGSRGAAISSEPAGTCGESTLSKQNVGRLGLKWKTQIDKEVSIEIESGNSMLTTPLVAQGVRTPQGLKTVVYTLSAGNTLAALDAATGALDLAPLVRQHRRVQERAELDFATQYVDGHSSDRQGEGHHLYAGGRRTTARHRPRHGRG